ncbi:MAG: glucose-1-phosphate cytidylyltransferase [Anaerolineae bacterium]|nr:glucose-1-phosphate cytidylyltransferase [Anaerolineae bacterium]
MKVVILAGGYGTRISEETGVKPKPMVEIGSQPILWHIMKIYSAYGLNEFIICLGYKGETIVDYFKNYYLRAADVTFDLAADRVQVHSNHVEPWKVTLAQTGLKTMTGGRIRAVRDYIGNDTFCLTYGDGVSDLDIAALVNFHRQEGALVTLTAVKPPGRFGAFSLPDGENRIYNFREKSDVDSAWINGGFFVVEPAALDYIDGHATVWEYEPLQRIAAEGKLSAYRHYGYWQNMDTLRDKNVLDSQWNSPNPPWKIWQD